MKKIVYIFFVCSNILPIGTDAFNYPINAESYSLSSGLTAWPYSYSQNPAILSFYENEEISFSHNSWFGDMNGQNLGIVLGKNKKKSLEITKWSIDGFELRDEIPSEEPLADFGATFLSAKLSSSLNIGSAKSIGLRFTQYFYSLYDRNVYGSNVDIGFYMKLNKISLGMAINNLGVINNGGATHKPVISLGSMYNLNKINSDVIVDLHSLVDEGNNQNKILLIIGAVKYFGSGKLYCSKVLNVGYNNEHVTDLSLGAEINVDRWKLRYGYQINSSNVLGNPQSIEIVFIF